MNETKESMVYLSIVVPTINRDVVLDKLLKSIEESCLDFEYEIIIVDQNQNGMIDNIIFKYMKQLPIDHYKVEFVGASKARNFGIGKSKGEIVCFPDDDAEYTPESIKFALKRMKKGIDCVFGKTIDKKTHKDSVLVYKTKSQRLTLKDHKNAFVEPTMFIRRNVVEKYMFDETMGVGCIYGSQEGYDLVYRMMKDNRVLYYYPDIVVYHPSKTVKKSNDAEVKRAFYYMCGHGHLCKKYGFKKEYRKEMTKLTFGILIIFVLKHKEIQYYLAQRMGLKLGYKYI